MCEAFLRAHGLPEFVDIMEYHGFNRNDEDSVTDLKALTDEELKQMGFPKRAREKYLTAIKASPIPQW
eukprot:gene1814-1958_t